MSTTPAGSPDPVMPGHVDVLIVGAGLSGIGAACHLQAEAPGTSYALVEARGASGGTWDLFRFPGVRSDSDMFTLGYPFRPWKDSRSIVGGAEILRYLRETAAAYGVDRQISYHTRVVRAGWSSQDARWTVTVEDTRSGERTRRTCGFLYLCSGYYRYDQGYTPSWPGQEDFAGTIVHPQHWPEDLDLTGQRVVVIGSGATAVTIVPAVAGTAAHVTMLQRSPSFVLPIPARDPVSTLLRKVLPERQAYAAVRWKNTRIATALYVLCRKYPDRARAVLRKGVLKRLPAGYDVDIALRPGLPALGPAHVPGPRRGLLRRHPVREGRRRDRPDRGVHPDRPATALGRPTRGRRGHHRDRAEPASPGGIGLAVDGEAVTISQRVAYKGMMLEDVPNMAFAIGYTNASWTLKVRPGRLLRHPPAAFHEPRTGRRSSPRGGRTGRWAPRRSST